MDRRDFLKATSVTAAAAATGATIAAGSAGAVTGVAPGVVTGRRELRLAMPWAQNGRGFDDSARRLAQSIATASEGRYRIAIVPEAGQLADLLNGAADLYHGSGHDFVALDRAFAYFAGLPGSAGLRPTYLSAWLTAGGGHTLWDDLAATHAFKPLLAGHSGARGKLWSRAPLSEPMDVSGRRIAAAGLAADVVRALGGAPVDITAADLGQALAGGAVDAVEWGGTIASYAADLARGATHCLRPGLSRNGFSTVLAVRAEVWADMGAADRALFAGAAAQELNTVVAESLAHGRLLAAALGERHGVTFAATAQPLREAAAQAAARVVAALPEQSAAAQRIHMSYQAFRAHLPAPRRRAAAVA